MEKITKFLPAFDKRDKNPNKNYGIHGADLLMILKGELGAIQFVVHTNWMLPHVQEELLNKDNNDKLTIKCRFIPMPSDVGYHSQNPIYDGQELMTNSCDLLDGKPCYYDGSTLHADKVFNILVEKGSNDVWEYLENYYIDIFGELK